MLGDVVNRSSVASGDVDGALNARSVTVLEPVGGGAVLRIAITDRPPLRAVEPVEEARTRSSSIPALGTRTEHLEQEGPAGVGIALTLASSRETFELGGESEAGGEAAADGTAVTAEEIVARAGDGVGVTAVCDDVLAYGLAGSGEDDDGGEKVSELHFETEVALAVRLTRMLCNEVD